MSPQKNTGPDVCTVVRVSASTYATSSRGRPAGFGDLRRRITPFQSLDDLADRSRRQVDEHDIVE